MSPTWHAVTTHERQQRAGHQPEVYATEDEAEAAAQRMVASGKGPVAVYAVEIEEEGA